MESGVVKSAHGCGASSFGPIIHKCTIALGYQEDTLNVICGVPRKVIFEVDDVGARREITDPERMTRLSGFSRRSTGYRRPDGTGP
jgi:hypothetical protein